MIIRDYQGKSKNSGNQKIQILKSSMKFKKKTFDFFVYFLTNVLFF